MSVKNDQLTGRGARYLGILVASFALLLTVFIILDLLGRSFPGIARSPSVWGSFGDWAAAILPAITILLSVDMWLTDKRREAERSAAEAIERQNELARTIEAKVRETYKELAGLRLVTRPGTTSEETWIENPSAYSARLHRIDNPGLCEETIILQSEEDAPLSRLGLTDTRSAIAEVRDEFFRVTFSGVQSIGRRP